MSVLSVAIFRMFAPQSCGNPRVLEKLSAMFYTLPEKIKITDIVLSGEESPGIMRQTYRKRATDIADNFSGVKWR